MAFLGMLTLKRRFVFHPMKCSIKKPLRPTDLIGKTFFDICVLHDIYALNFFHPSSFVLGHAPNVVMRFCSLEFGQRVNRTDCRRWCLSLSKGQPDHIQVNCILGLFWPWQASPILSYNSLSSVYDSLSTPIHLYMIRPSKV